MCVLERVCVHVCMCVCVHEWVRVCVYECVCASICPPILNWLLLCQVISPVALPWKVTSVSWTPSSKSVTSLRWWGLSNLSEQPLPLLKHCVKDCNNYSHIYNNNLFAGYVLIQLLTCFIVLQKRLWVWPSIMMPSRKLNLSFNIYVVHLLLCIYVIYESLPHPQ